MTEAPRAGIVVAMTETTAISVTGLTKRYGDRVVVDGLDIELPRGCVAGFIGPNGAGKTTTMAMLLGLVTPSAGTGTVLGQPLKRPADYLGRVGALIEGPALYPALTGAENLRVLATLGHKDTARIPDLLDLVGLADRADDRFREYSLGMKQRLGIAAALLGDPELVILDEPTNGLDPIGMREIRELIAGIAATDRTVLVSSHLLSELEQISDWLIVIEGGRGSYVGPAGAFLRDAAVLAIAPEDPADTEALGVILAAEGHAIERADGHLLIRVGEVEQRLFAASINRLAYEHDIVLAEMGPRRANLEDQYLTLVSGGRS